AKFSAVIRTSIILPAVNIFFRNATTGTHRFLNGKTSASGYIVAIAGGLHVDAVLGNLSETLVGLLLFSQSLVQQIHHFQIAELLRVGGGRALGGIFVMPHPLRRPNEARL